MQRITFIAQEQAEPVEVERDAGPLGANEVAGPSLATLISPGTELAMYQGLQPRSKFPINPGYAAVFRVDGVGSGVTDIRAGDLAFSMGAHQSFQRQTRDKVLPVPPGLFPKTAVFARMMAISMSTLTTTTARPPAKVLVTGLGLVGHLAARVFDLCGYEVIACDPAEARRRTAEQAGIRHVLPRAPLDDPAIAGKVALVLECSGHEQAALDGCNVVQRRGEVVLVGVPWARKTALFAHDILDAVFRKYAVLRSGWEWELPLQTTDFRQNSIFGNLGAALRWLAEGHIRVDGLYALASPRNAQEVYQGLLRAPGGRLTALFDWMI